MARELPIGTVTFLFSDIEGSTRLAQALGTDGWRTTLEAQQAIWRAAFGASNGTEISTEGDSFFAVFPSALDAVSAAAAGQRAIHAASWPSEAGPAGLRIRVGLHTGEGRLGGDSYVGVDVHRAARIAAAANGGQVLISASTRALTESSLPAGVSLLDVGRHRLKDLDQPEVLSRLVIAGLDDDSRPPRSLETPTNLPDDLTTFVGREQELGAVAAAVRGGRLVTLTGPGGTGKTRLSLAAASGLLADFPDGVHFVQLAPISDPGLVTTTILAALAIRQEAGADAEQLIVNHLAGRTALLVLDNFEQVVAAAPLVTRLLAAAPKLHVLVSSREVLHLRGEQELPVPPLTLPVPAAAGAALDPVAIASSEAVALFVARARAVAPSFAISAANAPAIVGICTSLDGLPLAIELAAARVKVLSPDAILARLQHDLGLLASSERDLPERQRTLRGAIAWSYDLLDPAEQALFRRAAIFVGGWTLEAVEAVCDPDSELGRDALDVMTSLLDKSLIRSGPAIDDELRFRYLTTIREFGLEQLAEVGELDEMARRHAAFFTTVAARLAEPLTGSDVVQVVARLDADYDNLRAAIRWSIESGEALMALRILGCAWRFWYQGSHLAEGRALVEEALRLPAAAGLTQDRAIGLNGAGGIVYWLADFDVAERYWTEALAINEALGDTAGMAEGHYNLSFTAMIASDFPRQRAHFDAALALYESIGDTVGVINVRESMVPALMRAGELAEGEELLKHTVVAQRARGHIVRISEDLALLATFQAMAGHLEQAVGSALEALQLADQAGTLTSVTSALAAAALIDTQAGRPERAATIGGALEAIIASTQIVITQVAMLGLPPTADVARAMMEPEAFARAYAAGRAMDRAAVIAYALEGLAERQPPG
ncbi:MAG TPA: adenylate/guanylate cyclase domain-containing protein [Candidatus Limnocylindrales bacterium]|nr:adenylate/guanylate cyclase domain-containing protein [Candidatus Limnocylindrales bacterium]